MHKLRVLDLFAGIGGFSLGLERTGGFRTVAFCERDAFATGVLAKHWPGVPVFDDVCTLHASSLAEPVDVVCGGFPCQDISLAGKGAGLAGARSGLWFEMLRIIDETRPRYVIAENVAALRGRGLDVVLRSLASIGYDAEWHLIPASAVGANHRRDRIWIVAYADREPRHERRPSVAEQGAGRRDADRGGIRADSLANAYGSRLEIVIDGQAGQLAPAIRASHWTVEPDVGRVAYGVSSRVDRLKCLGNSLVPQIPEIIGRAILSRAYKIPG